MSEGSDDNLPTASSALAALRPAAIVLLGISIWSQTALAAYRDEVTLGGLAAIPVLMSMVQLGALGLGVFRRSELLLLAAFPLSLLPPAIMVESLASVRFDSWGVAQSCATMAIYLALSSHWLSSRGTTPQVEPIETRGDRAAVYRRFVYPRIFPLVLLWAVPTYAIFWDPAIASTISQNHPDGAVVPQIFMAMLVFFGWSIVAYMSFVVPALNLEYDYRRIAREIASVPSLGEPASVRARLGLAAGITVTATIGFLFIV